MQNKNLISLIEKNKKELSNSIRSYFESQKEDWQKIPWLALQVDGRGGYNSHFTMMYKFGVLTFDEIKNIFGGAGAGVDLETGKLVELKYDIKRIDVFGIGDDEFDLQLIDAEDKDILILSKCYDSYDAKKEIKYLEQQIKNRDTPYYGSGKFKTNEQWRNSLIKKLGLEKDRYIRKESEWKDLKG